MHKIGLKLTIAQHGEIQLSRIQVNDGIFRNDPQPTNQPTNKAGSRDAIASKNSFI